MSDSHRHDTRQNCLYRVVVESSVWIGL